MIEHVRVCRILTALALPVAVLPAGAQQQKPLYEIKKERVRTWRADAQGRPALYVTVQLKIVRPDGQLAEDVNPVEIVVEEDQRRVTDLKVQTPAALETLTAVLAID